MLRYSFAALFMGRPMFLLTFPGKKKKNGTWSQNTCEELSQKTVPLKTGIIFKIYADDRIHYLNSCKRLDDDDYDVNRKL